MSEEEIYDEEGREEMGDDSEISPEEEGFMKGYDDADEEEPKEDKEDKEE